MQASDHTYVSNNPNETDSLLYCLLKSPAHAHTLNIKFREDYNSTFTEQLFPLWKSIIEKLEEKNPIFFLAECNGVDCNLKRSSGSFRNIFEDSLVKMIHSDSKNSYCVLSFAPRLLFQDLVIFTKALHQNPTLSLNLHLIDSYFYELSEFIRFTQESNSTFDVEACYEHMTNNQAIEKLKKRYPQFQNPQYEQRLMYNVYYQYFVLRQFALFFRNYFPVAHVTINIYKDATSFKEESSHVRPDLIYTADIEDDRSIENKLYDHYLELIEQFFPVQNLWLGQQNKNKIFFRRVTQVGTPFKIKVEYFE